MSALQERETGPEVPVVSTRLLFATLLRSLDVDTVCDIGSMNGSDALRFRKRCPNATVIAFEANPRNFERMRNDPALAAADIRCEPLAMTDTDGSADFFVVRPYSPEVPARRGMSSLYQRREADQLEAVVRVQTARVDTYLAEHVPNARRIALWIDVEGKAFEVISGAHEVLSKVYLLHVEVERTPRISDTQKIYADVYALLLSADFEEIATDYPVHGTQFNTLWIRKSDAVSPVVQRALMRARRRRRVTDAVYRLLPVRVRHYLAGRFGIRGSIP